MNAPEEARLVKLEVITECLSNTVDRLTTLMKTVHCSTNRIGNMEKRTDNIEKRILACEKQVNSLGWVSKVVLAAGGMIFASWVGMIMALKDLSTGG